MILESGTELIKIFAGENYKPTFISTDKRLTADKTSIGYYQIGADSQHGFAKGPVFKIEVVDISNILGVLGAAAIKIWGIENEDDDGVEYPLSYFDQTKNTNKVIHVWLKKIEIVNSSSEALDVSLIDYTIVGYKKKVMPIAW